MNPGFAESLPIIMIYVCNMAPDMEIPALFASYRRGELVASASWFDGVTPRRTGGTVPFADAASSVPRSDERNPVVVVDSDSLGNHEFREGVVKTMKVRGSDIWLMTWIETADDLFDAFNTNAEVVMGPYHASRSDADLEDILGVSDSFVPAVFAVGGRAVGRMGKTGDLERTVSDLRRIGFGKVCVLDTDRRVSGYTWGNLSDTVPNLLPFTDRTTSAGISGTWISPLLLG